MLELGVCYYPEQWDRDLWREDAQRMVALGLDWVRIAEFSWVKVEPKYGVFDWGWLDDVIDILGSAGLKVMMSTPTAAPPKWLIDAHPDTLAVGESGTVRKFGARRHYCFSSETYRHHAARIAREFASRYGDNPHVHAWQIDNEYGDHDTIRSYSEGARLAFRHWLAETYDTVDALNEVWGNTFWSMSYGSFNEIDLPNNLVEEPNPSHAMDFARFSSDQVRAFNQIQVDILHQLSPGRPVSHNFMANSFDYDHYPVASDLDFACWDSYPMGALVDGPQSDEEKQQFLRTGSPDYQSFYSDFYRHLGNGKVWITEQQPGPVNWANFNQAPADGMVRLWTWMAYAHGVDAVFYFRWRQAPFAQEQFHSALLLSDGTPDQAYHEVAQIARERALLPVGQKRKQAKVALVLDYPSRWAHDILPQGQTRFAPKIAFDWYQSLAERGVDVDVVGPASDLTGYALVLIPDLMIENAALAQRLMEVGAKVVLGARVGSKTLPLKTPDKLAPGAFADLIAMRVLRVESLPPSHKETIAFGDQTFETTGWRESIETSEPVLATFCGNYRSGWPAIVGNDKCRYIGCLLDGGLLHEFLANCAGWAGVDIAEPDPFSRITRRGKIEFTFNFKTSEVAATPTSDTWDQVAERIRL